MQRTFCEPRTNAPPTPPSRKKSRWSLLNITITITIITTITITIIIIITTIITIITIIITTTTITIIIITSEMMAEARSAFE